MLRSRTRWIAAAAGRTLIVMTAAALVGCGEESVPTGLSPTGPTGRVRFVNAVADPLRADRLDVTVAGTPVAVNVGFGVAAPNTAVQPNPAPYYPVYAGSWPVVARRTADPSIMVLSQNIDVTASTDYTVLAVGTSAGVSGVVLIDANAAPTGGNIRLRLVHASPSSAPAVDVYVTAPTADISQMAPSASNVAFKAASAYLTVAAGTYRVRVTATGSKTPLVDATTGALTTGAVRSFVLLDRSAGGVPATSVLLVDR